MKEIPQIHTTDVGTRIFYTDNGSGIDHEAAGVALALGPKVKGGMYSEYPETRPEVLKQGGRVLNQGYRGGYSTILEDWLHIDTSPIINGPVEAQRYIENGGS